MSCLISSDYCLLLKCLILSYSCLNWYCSFYILSCLLYSFALSMSHFCCPCITLSCLCLIWCCSFFSILGCLCPIIVRQCPILSCLNHNDPILFTNNNVVKMPSNWWHFKPLSRIVSCDNCFIPYLILSCLLHQKILTVSMIMMTHDELVIMMRRWNLLKVLHLSNGRHKTRDSFMHVSKSQSQNVADDGNKLVLKLTMRS